MVTIKVNDESGINEKLRKKLLKKEKERIKKELKMREKFENWYKTNYGV